MAIRRKQIRTLVDSLLKEHGISSPPVDVYKIAGAHGIVISRENVEDEISGFLYRDRDDRRRVIIGANKSHHINRQRFTIAHELGHFFLHDGELVHLDSGHRAFTINRRDEESSKSGDNDEKEANFFAAELLMPVQFLARDIQDVDVDLFEDSNLLVNLSRKYKVSVQALTFRLANLGYIQL